MKVLEVMGMRREEPLNGVQFQGFTLQQEQDDYDEDVKKIFHSIKIPGGKVERLDHSPYQFVDSGAFKRYVFFFKKHKHFPTRRDINSNGPLDNKTLHGLTS